MAQTTTQISVAAAKTQVSTNGSTWVTLGSTAISGSFSGMEQHTGQVNTVDGDAPIVTGSNKHTAGTVEIRSVWTPTSSEAWDTIRNQWEGSNTKVLYFRYSPEGGLVGDLIYTAARDDGTAFACPIVNCLPPSFDAGSGEVAIFMFSLMIPKFAETTLASSI
jgi:hypothetical protein